jgi:hypothetical protein
VFRRECIGLPCIDFSSWFRGRLQIRSRICSNRSPQGIWQGDLIYLFTYPHTCMLYTRLLDLKPLEICSSTKCTSVPGRYGGAVAQVFERDSQRQSLNQTYLTRCLWIRFRDRELDIWFRDRELDRRREWQGLCQKEMNGWEGARGYDCGRHNTKTVNTHTHTVWRTQCLETTIKQVVCSQNESFRSCRCYQPLRISHRKK